MQIRVVALIIILLDTTEKDETCNRAAGMSSFHYSLRLTFFLTHKVAPTLNVKQLLSSVTFY